MQYANLFGQHSRRLLLFRDDCLAYIAKTLAEKSKADLLVKKRQGRAAVCLGSWLVSRAMLSRFFYITLLAPRP